MGLTIAINAQDVFTKRTIEIYATGRGSMKPDDWNKISEHIVALSQTMEKAVAKQRPEKIDLPYGCGHHRFESSAPEVKA